jgi:hypothetical protein
MTKLFFCEFRVYICNPFHLLNSCVFYAIAVLFSFSLHHYLLFKSCLELLLMLLSIKTIYL